ncbi:hypothetical protein [Winogradskyella thalassocola]|uniref:Uncharacterized protein n=1 Tax=Winogradskyella thalassocola TaxID=262004 RepID=A0A1G8D3J7_9FLAO|nr:hypothetical protein [Winogradskyella thalassocola]SDH52282.1 hypothetical protein SAMN04489796_103113 [Winogradskyella thalassocola]
MFIIKNSFGVMLEGFQMEEIEVTYTAHFWATFSLPPPTDYYKKSIKELEANFGIPIETQFELVNK